MTVFKALALAALLLLPFDAFADSAELQKSCEYNLDISFDIAGSKVKGSAVTGIEAGKEIVFNTGSLGIVEVKMNNRQIHFNVSSGVLKILPSQSGSIEIIYEGIFSANKENPGAAQDIIDDRGISLTGLWYPRTENLCNYRLKAALPEGYTAVSEAETVRKSAYKGRMEFSFEFPHPASGITFVAGNRYEETRDNYNSVDIYAYFFRGKRDFAKKHIEAAKKYLKLYEGIIGKYPYKRFSIVENFLPSGCYMPTYVLLGQDVVKQADTSLGREILSQWLGNYVYADYKAGNWVEGLTTYLSDHLYEEQSGRGWEYRKQLLIDYASYVNSKNEFPLKEFKGGQDPASKAIVSGKGAMFFHMLKNMAGEDKFYNALRDFIENGKYQRASWNDLKNAFEKNYEKDLSKFFDQWVNTAGMPEIHTGAFRIKKSGGGFEASFNISQKDGAYSLDLPVTVQYMNGASKKIIFKFDKMAENVKLSLDGMPESIIIDADYDVARMLSEAELPPVISRLLGDEKQIIALPPAQGNVYNEVAGIFKEKGAAAKDAAEIRDSDIKSSSIVALGSDNLLNERLYGGKPALASRTTGRDAGFNIAVRENPWNPQKVVAVIDAKSKEEAEAAAEKIFHHGKYSVVSFDRGRSIYKETAEAQRGIKMERKERTTAIDMTAVRTLPDIIESASRKKIVYIGEYHDRFSHHEVQLQVIKSLYAKNKKIAIGMEMFEKPSQLILDDYIAGNIEEREFLGKTEYFKRWGFDYNLYKPILDFARSEKIPVIAMNIRREIVERVSKNGIESLSEEEKKEIPLSMDFSNEEYRKRLKDIFFMHNGASEKNFDFFYQSQVLWDESMSQSIDDFFRKYADFRRDGQMAVIAGSGHLSYGYGIPDRTFRRNGYDYAVILNDTEIEKGIANFIVFPAPVEGETSPKLMVILKEEAGAVSIVDFPENSVSEKAGLYEGDIILSLDDIPVATFQDLKIHLFYKKKGDTVKVKVKRKRFLFGYGEKEYEVML